MSKNKKLQYLFFSLLAICSFFNAGNSDIYIQINFLFFSCFLIYCFKDKNYFAHAKKFVFRNIIFIYIFLLFLFYLIFQLTPLPFELLKIFASEKYIFLKQMGVNKGFFSISYSSSDTYFQILNYISIFIIILLVKMIFYNQRHVYRFYYFLTLLGAFHSSIAIYFYLNGNPDFLLINNFAYKNSSTGLFINRTVFSIFLIFCLISGLEYLKNISGTDFYKNKDNFFRKIYIRIFIIFITVGVITTFSKLGNFIMFLTIIFYLFQNYFIEKNSNKIFSLVLIFIVFLDILILGFYFGGDKLLERFLFLKEDFAQDNNSINISRLEIINFSYNQFKNYFIFGYGAGAFENIFKINFVNSSSLFANHAHSDIFEFLGEFGILGFTLFALSFSKIFFKKQNYNFKFNLLLLIGILILLFDFSLHIPLVQILYVSLIILALNQINNNHSVWFALAPVLTPSCIIGL